MRNIIFAVSLMFLLMPVAYAQQATTDDPGITPDSFLWGIDKAFDQLALFFTVGPEAKAYKGLEIAHERLLEVKAMAEKNKIDAVAKAEDAHSKILLSVKQSVQSIKADDAEIQIKKVIEFEKRLKEHLENVKKVRAELKFKIKIEGTLSAEQQARLDDFLKSLENSSDELKLEIKNKKNDTKVKIKQETGQSDEEIENKIRTIEFENGVLEEELKVRAEIFGDKSFVKVEREFETRTTDKESLIGEIIERFSLSASEANSLLRIETEDEDEIERDRLRIRVEIEGGIAEVEIKLRFSLNSVDRSTIINAVVSKTNLTRSDVENALRLKVEGDDEEETEIKVEIGTSRAKVKLEVGDAKTRFFLETTDRQAILEEIASRLGVSIEVIRDLVEFKIEDEEIEDAKEEAEDKIDDAEEEVFKAAKKINREEAEGKDTLEAIAKLTEARSQLKNAKVALNAGNFEEAEQLARDAKRSAKAAHKTIKFVDKDEKTDFKDDEDEENERNDEDTDSNEIDFDIDNDVDEVVKSITITGKVN